MSAPTPGPWKVTGKKTIRAVNDGVFYDLIAKTHWYRGEENAAFIVTACNQHAQLVAQNERLREALEMYRQARFSAIAGQAVCWTDVDKAVSDAIASSVVGTAAEYRGLTP